MLRTGRDICGANLHVLLIQILETSTSIDPSTLALSNTPRDNETLVSQITGDLAGLGLR